jgi:regulation of enolase protein 1 (concanavalin A-like superfamily)
LTIDGQFLTACCGRRLTSNVAFCIAVFSALIISSSSASAQTPPPAWTVADVGTPAIPGYATHDNGVFTISGAGDRIGGRSDQFTFASRALTGDGTIVARITGVTNATAQASIGLMLRDGVDPRSAHAFLFVSPSGRIAFQRRTRAGAPATATVHGGTAPIWLRLGRRASTITASWSADGMSWTTLGTDDVPLSGVVQAGLAVSSGTPVAAARARFTDVTVSSLAESGRPLPAGWNSQDIGAPAGTGAAAYEADTFALMGAGDVSGPSDRFHFAYKQLDGDVDIVARVRAVGDARRWSRAGVMIRESLAPNAMHASMLVSSGRGTAFQRRSQPGADSVATSGSTNRAAVWVKLSLRSGEVSAYESVDGVSWVLVGTDTLTVPSPFYIGLAVASADEAETVTTNIDNVQVQESSISAAASSFEVSAAKATPRGDVTAAAVPSGWAAADIGSPAIAGSASYSNGTYTIKAGGADVWGTADEFHYVYRSVSGDFDVVSRVASIQETDPWSKAGVMIRSALTANAAYAAVFVAASQPVAYQRRTTTGATTVTTNVPGAPPLWVKLVRRGGVITASTSVDGTTWTVVGTQTLTLPASFYVGIAVASASATAATTAVVDNVSVTAVTANQAPAVALTTPANGATFTAPATMTVGATASDTDGTIARVDFYQGTTLIGSDATSPYSVTWSNVAAGTYALTARATDNAGAATTSAARSVTVTTAPANQPPTVALTAPAAGATFTAPATVTVSATASDTDGTVTRVDFYQGVTLIGSDTTSPYSITWSNVPAGTYSLTARATDNAAATTTSAARSITIVAANQVPSVSLTSPTNGATFTAPATLTVSATASDTDGTIARVDFYQGTTLIGSDSASPYSIAWSNVGAGSYTLTARATDNAGATTTSTARSVTVTASPANQPPTVTLTAPAAGATFTAPATVTVTATAGDTDGTVTRVDFYQGATLIGSDTTSPYSISWGNVGSGSYSLTARATDNAGAAATSAARTITVTGLPSGWTAADVGSPAIAGSTSYSNGTYTVRAGGEDVWGTADEFHYVYRQVSGDFDVVSRVVSIQEADPWSKAGVMIRATQAADAVYAALFVAASQPVAYQRRTTTGGTTVTTNVAGTAPLWVKLTRRGTAITAFTSSDGTTWTAVGSQTLVLPASFYVGVAVASVSATTPTTGVVDSVAVTAPAANQLPVVSLTAPADGATFTAPATIAIGATASDSDGAITRVDFYQGSTLIGSDATSPYGLTWTNVPAGAYSLTARAVDNAGATTTSLARSVTVTSSATQRYAVFTASADHNTLVNSYLLEIFAPGANPATATPVATQNVGKPGVVNGECTANVTATISALASGNYQATIAAVGSGGMSRSAPVVFSR